MQFAPSLGRLFAAIFVLLGSLFVGSRAATDPLNRLTNPGFEDGINGWTVYGMGGTVETAANTYYNGGVQAGASNVLVWEGAHVQKVFPAFTGGPNYNGIYQDFPTGAGSVWSATAKFLTHSQDQIGVTDNGVTNQCWLEVTFRDEDNFVLATYKSLTLDNSSPTNTWLDMNVLNNEGGITLTAPDGTKKVRLQEVYYQPSGFAGGSVYADAMTLDNITPSDPGLISLATNSTKIVGQTATFAVSATGRSTLHYLWTRNGETLTDGSAISGATTSTLTISNLQKSDIGTYKVVVSDDAGSIETSATLNVKTAEEAANLLENPGFETGNYSPWVKVNGGGIVPDGSLTPFEGSYMASAFNGGEFNVVYQDIAAKAGDAFTPEGWFMVSALAPLVNTTAWLELQFRNGATPLALYRSSIINANTVLDTWVHLRATNGFAADFSTPIGNSLNPIAPTGTTSVRYQVTLQSASGTGTVYFDSMTLIRTSAPTLAAARNGANIDITFATENGISYEVVYKDNLQDPAWTPIAGTIVGDGSGKTVSYTRTGGRRFYMVRVP